jgi:hypothetical protein
LALAPQWLTALAWNSPISSPLLLTLKDRCTRAWRVFRRLNVPGQVPFNPDFDAATAVTTNDVVWSFFAAHPKR